MLGKREEVLGNNSQYTYDSLSCNDCQKTIKQKEHATFL